MERRVYSRCGAYWRAALLVVGAIAAGCAHTPRYRSVVIRPAPTGFFDSETVGKPADNLNASYNNLLQVCAQRLGALEQEYEAVSGRTAAWRTVLLTAGGLSAMGSAGYAVFEDDPDPKVVGVLGLFGAGTLSANFGFLTEAERLSQLDADAARIAADLGAARTAADGLELAGLNWSRLPDCDPDTTACVQACAEDAACKSACNTRLVECAARLDQANKSFDDARVLFVSSVRNAHLNCLASR